MGGLQEGVGGAYKEVSGLNTGSEWVEYKQKVS